MIKKVSVLLMIGILLFTATDVQAAKYAYSIGTNWGTSGLNVGDYTGNVSLAQTFYLRINNVVSNYNFKPTPTYIRSNNPNGNRIIASKIVFLNGHASAKRIYFNHMNNTSYMTGVCAGTDKVESGYTFAGLSSTDMSSCNLITFAGCDTAYVDANDYNLVEKAVARGANTAVGFKGTIYSLNTAGKNWLYIYNESLATGYSVSQSIRAAANAYPTDAMTTTVQIGGDPTKAFNSTLTASASVSYNNEPTVELEDVGNMDATEFEESYIVSKLEEFDSSIDLSDYKVSVNMFDPEGGNGYVIFTYYIDGVIETNKAYVCHIEGNKLAYIVDTLELEESAVEVAMTEGEMLAKVDAHQESKVPKTTTRNLVNLEEYVEKYYYDYKTNTLSYREYMSVNDTELDVQIPTVNETNL